jgi:hypothetical protein
MRGFAVGCGHRRHDVCPGGAGRTGGHRRIGAIGDRQPQSRGLQRRDQLVDGYDTVPLAVCTVESVDNPDDSNPKPGAFTTVYVDVSCPNHPDE